MANPQSSIDNNSNNNIYKYISTHDFTSDPEFRNGLGTILGHPGQPASIEELASEDDDVVLQAKCFYISRKKNLSPPIDFTAYKNWLIENQLSPGNNTASPDTKNDGNVAVATSSTSNTTTTTITAAQENKSKEENSKNAEPAYPSSFAHIVELITTNQPIPGIEEIPDTVLSGHDEPSKASKRRKPWEKDLEVASDENQA